MSDGAETVELPVWIGGCEKWVTGLTKRTTCDDIVYALLQHDTNPNDGDVDVTCFGIFERWRDVERPLRGRTKILKVWKAWGDECANVRFSVRKVDVPMDTSSEISRTRRSRRHYSTRERRSREKTRGRPSGGGGGSGSGGSGSVGSAVAAGSTAGMIRKDYGPIDAADRMDAACKAQAFHELVQIVLEQEKRIQEQLTRIQDTDAQIENYETKMHELRMRENGQNYVQEAYLRDRSDESSSGGEELFPAIKANDLEAYMHMCENILHLEDQITDTHDKILDISYRIQEESFVEAPPQSIPSALTSTPVRGRSSSPSSSSSAVTVSAAGRTGAAHQPPPSVECPHGARSGPLASVPEDQLQEEIERLRSDLQRSRALSEAQQRQLQLSQQTMSELDGQINHKGDLIRRMLYEFNIAEHATAAPPPVVDGGGGSGDMSENGYHSKDRHSSSTSGVSEVSELEGSDRSTSRPRGGGDSRSRERARDPSGERSKSRERSLSSAGRGRGSTPNLAPLFPRDRSGSVTSRSKPAFHPPRTLNTLNKPPAPDPSPPPYHHTQGEEYYVTRTLYPPPPPTTPSSSSTYRDNYLNGHKNISDDSNSDTGLSSLHSDEAPPILETLV